jgi:hypothetical protein
MVQIPSPTMLQSQLSVIGHSAKGMTRIYAEIDFEAARKIMMASG